MAEIKLAKIEQIEFGASKDTAYAKATRSNKTWWHRAFNEPEGAAKWITGFVSVLGATIFTPFSLFSAAFLAGGVDFATPLYISGAGALLSWGGLHLNSRWNKEINNKVFADPNQRFFFRLASGVEILNRRVKAWNGMLAALALGAEDRMSQGEKENIFRMLSSAREELAAEVELAEGLMLPPHDARPQVEAYLEDLREAAEDLPGRTSLIPVPERALNANKFQEVLENEVALFDYAGELKALPPKKD